MKTISISNDELNFYVVTYPSPSGQLNPAKKWERIDNVAGVEAYIGDGIYIIALVRANPKNMAALRQNTKAVEVSLIAYLKAEAMIGEEYLYIGLQDIDITNLPKGLNLDLKRK